MSAAPSPSTQANPVYEERVDADAAMAFALATHDPNQASRQGLAAPPLYTTSLIMRAFSEGWQRAVAAAELTPARALVHGTHDMYFHHPVPLESDVLVETTPYRVKQTPPGAMVTQRMVVSDRQGRPLVEHFWSNICVGAIAGNEFGPPAADHAFPEQAREHLIGAERYELPFDQSFRYSGVTGDRAGHAMNLAAAQAEGFPSRLVQGLCTLAICSGAVVKLAGDGDPERLSRLAVRMSAPLFARQDLSVEVYDAGLTPAGGRAIAFEAHSAGVTVMKHGRAEFRPA
ncbi:MAG: MaoC domain protein dehydratase [Frankiales bacterium]|jgi:acyl dehydratase|nr:MaoC domain protein dehydratase [Frankiales bacterium]